MEKQVYETSINTSPCPPQKGWLLSRGGDLWVFILLTGVALSVPLIWDVTYHSRYLPLTVILYDGLIVLGHGFAGYGLFLIFRHRVSPVVLAGAVFLILGASVGFYRLWPRGFMTCTFLGLLAHHIYQQYFWLQYLKRKGGKVQRHDFVMLLNVCLMPCLVHFTHPFIAFKAFSVEGGWLNTFVAPPGLSQVLNGVFWLVSFVYIFVDFKRFKRPGGVCYGKYVLILNGFLCFYLPLVVFPGYFVFAPPCHLPHALAYILFVHNLVLSHFRRHPHSARGIAPLCKGLCPPLRSKVVFMGVLGVLGSLWAFGFNRGIIFGGSGVVYEVVLSLACGLLWVHFFWDIVFLNFLLRSTKPKTALKCVSK